MREESLKGRFMRSSMLAGVAVATALSAAPVAAVAQDGTTEEIFITGSRIGRSDETSIAPISVFSAEDIARSGEATLENFMQNAPVVNGYMNGSSINNGNPGIATTSLRGLGAGRTLILVDGHRAAPSNLAGEVDLNSINNSNIERIEILRDGASTIYGSDAVAGVVNIITKKHFEGAEIMLQYDVTDEKDGEIYRAGMTIGGNIGKGHVTLNAEYVKRNAIWQKDRSFSECPLTNEVDTNDDGMVDDVLCGGSGTSYPGQFFNDNYGGHVVDNGVVREFQPSDGYNYSATSAMVTPMESYHMNGYADYDLWESEMLGDVSAFMHMNFSKRKSFQRMAPVGTFQAPVMTADHPDNPVGEDINVARRLAEAGGRQFNQELDALRMVWGLEGSTPYGVDWDIVYNYGRMLDARLEENQLNKPNSANPLSPTLCAADPNCPGLWNPLATGTLTPELRDYITISHSPFRRQTQDSLQMNLTGETDMLNSVLDGALGWAAGYEHRRQKATHFPDGAAVLDQIYFVSGEQTSGKWHVNEFYGEVRLPILEGREMADLLAVEASIRHSKYNTRTGNATNYKVSVEYAPMADIRLRGTWTTGLRAPSISESFAPQQQSAQQYNDPCLNLSPVTTDPVVYDNCSNGDGLPDGFTLASTQAGSVLGGNPDLIAEESESWNIGAVFTPSQLPNFSASFDYYNITITDAIGIAGTDTIITGCYESANFSSPLCDLIVGATHPIIDGATHTTAPDHRNAQGEVSGVLLTNANIGRFETQGVDFSASYFMEIPPINAVDLGTFSVNLDGTYLLKYKYQPTANSPFTSVEGFIAEDNWEGGPAGFNEWKVNLSAAVENDMWAFSWNTRFLSKIDDINASAGNLNDHIGLFTYHDIQGSLFHENYTLTFGIKNLFDKDPTYVTNNDDMNVIPATYDTAGRYLYFRVGARF